MFEKFPFLVIVTVIALFSMRVNSALTQNKFSADKAFWYAWLFLIWSAEIVTSFPFFEYYSQYPIDQGTRELVLATLLSALVGFLIGSYIYRRMPGGRGDRKVEEGFISFLGRKQNFIALSILLIGAYEFILNQNKFSDLQALRYAAVTGDLTYGSASVQFFYFAQAFLLFLGFSDGTRARVSKLVAFAATTGLVFHNLSLGGRINVIVGPALYLIAYAVSASGKENRDVIGELKRTLVVVTALIMTVFTALRLLRGPTDGMSYQSSVLDSIINAMFAIPMYVSDTYISISVHAMHASEASIPYGYYTFDAAYRLFGPILSTNLVDSSEVFGHIFYRDTPAPWAWTQTNMIPRLIADFGAGYWVAIIPIFALAQWGSVYRFRMVFLGNAIRSMMILCSAYSILGIFWFSAFTVLTLFYAFAIYLICSSIRGVRI